MKIKIPEDLRGKDLYKFVFENKAALIAQKKALPKYTDTISCAPTLFRFDKKEAIKANAGEIPADASSILVTLVANACLWCDSQMDVLQPNSAAKTIKDGNGKVHLHDHIYRLDAQVGDVQKIAAQDVALTDLGLNKPGATQCIVYTSDVQKSYNPFVFTQYKTGKINQHSIGLQYVKLELAINDEEYEKEMDFWNKYYPTIINKEVVDEMGFFWVVNEIKLLEVSAVLFGSNVLTPTLNVNGKDTLIQPEQSTEEKPLQVPKAFDVDQAIKTTKFLI